MKTYILRTPNTVEPQNRPRPPLPPSPPAAPALTATGDVSCGPATPVPPALGPRVLYVGLDVHNDSSAVSLAPSDSAKIVAGNARGAAGVRAQNEKQKARSGGTPSDTFPGLPRAPQAFSGRVQPRMERTFGAITRSNKATATPRLSPFQSFGG